MGKRTMHQRFITLFLVAILLSAISVPPIAAETLRVGERFAIDSLDPAQGGTFVKEKALIAETLVDPDPDFILVPGLAESWTMVSDTVWEFRLRKGVCLHNGAALTARMAADSIARAILTKPALVVLDEATSMVDVSVQAAVIHTLRDLYREHGTAYLFITHDMALANAFCDEILCMESCGVFANGGVAKRYSVLQSLVEEPSAV